MNALIVAGGRGSRLGSLTADRPKPLVEIGGRPVLWHVIESLRARGIERFVVAVGYRGDQIAERFADDDSVEVIDTGPDTGTAGRIGASLDRFGDERIVMAWSDGLSDVDLDAMVATHARTGRVATVMAVRPPERFGRLELDGDRVSSFVEKKPASRVSGGLFVLEPTIRRFLSGDTDESWERGPMPKLVEEGQLTGHRHDGYWACMDLPHEVDELNERWASGPAPWIMQAGGETKA